MLFLYANYANTKWLLWRQAGNARSTSIKAAHVTLYIQAGSRGNKITSASIYAYSGIYVSENRFLSLECPPNLYSLAALYLLSHSGKLTTVCPECVRQRRHRKRDFHRACAIVQKYLLLVRIYLFLIYLVLIYFSFIFNLFLSPRKISTALSDYEAPFFPHEVLSLYSRDRKKKKKESS